MSNQLLTYDLAEPMDGAKTVKVDIDTSMGNLTIDSLNGSGELLTSGTLEYPQNWGQPTVSVTRENGDATLTLMAGYGRKSSFRFPWQAWAAVASKWQIHINPKVQTDITAHTGGGNLRLNLDGMIVTHLKVDSGGGNLEVVLPQSAANMDATAKTGGGSVIFEIGRDITGSSSVDVESGAGTVAVSVPGGNAARIHAGSGLGKVRVDPRFAQVDEKTYQSPDYDSAVNKVEVTALSGAGNVSINSD
jgi:hypothetical protein